MVSVQHHEIIGVFWYACLTYFTQHAIYSGTTKSTINSFDIVSTSTLYLIAEKYLI